MNIAKVLKTMWRHWLIVLIVLIATGPVARAVGEQVKPVFEASGTLLFLSPAVTTGPDGSIRVNPFARLGSAERVVASTVLIVSSTKEWKDRMEAAGATGEYSYAFVSDGVVGVTTTANTPTGAMTTLTVSIQLLQQELARRQERAGAPPDSWITAEILSMSDQPSELLGSKVRTWAGVMVLGLAAAATTALTAEALGVGGRRPRWKRVGEDDDDGVLPGSNTERVPAGAPPFSPENSADPSPWPEPRWRRSRRQRRRERRASQRSGAGPQPSGEGSTPNPSSIPTAR